MLLYFGLPPSKLQGRAEGLRLRKLRQRLKKPKCASEQERNEGVNVEAVSSDHEDIP